MTVAARADTGAAATVLDGLAEAAGAFGARGPFAEDTLVFTALVAELAPSSAGSLALAVELVFEGYLAHYRESRLLDAACSDTVRLLAGDYFYAHGLRTVARRGDVGAVALLTRLMATCAYLRVERQSFALDDALWDLAVRGVAVGAGGPARGAAREAFDAIEAAIVGGRVAALAGLVTAAAARVRAAGRQGG